MENKRLPKLCADEVCTGCSACANACDSDAIQIIRNNEGFYRPQVDNDKCIGCLKCERRCPLIKRLPVRDSLGKVYAGWNKDAQIRKESTSGGAFSALAETVLENKGVVVGAAYSSQMQVCHICITDKADLGKLRLSKYVQSRIGNVFKDIKEYLLQDRIVLFCGTPCQVAGLRAFLVKEYDNLICCDFICHGVPSPLMLEKYLDWLNTRMGKVKHLNFRDKRKGWYDSLRVVTLENEKKRVLKGKNDAFWVAFNNWNSNLQNSCYDCQFLGVKRLADITIADFWGVGKSIPFGHKDEIEKGISMLMGNNSKGVEWIQKCHEKMELHERTFEEAVKQNQTFFHSAKKPADRESFYKDLQSLSFDEMIRRHMTPSYKTKLVKLFREYLPFPVIEKIRMKDQK